MSRCFANHKLSAALLFLLAALCPLLVSCGPAPETEDPAVAVWHWMSDREPAFLELARQYKKATGVEVRFDLYAPSDAYVQKIRAAAQTNTLPDIFGILGESRDVASYISAGHVEDLTPAMTADRDAWKNRFFAKALSNNTFVADNSYKVKEGVYGVPLDVTNIQFLYNKDIFQKAGLDPEKPPSTWPEFLKTAEAFKKIGVTGFVSGWGELWMIECFASNLAFNLMGEAKVLETIRGNVKYTDPEWIRLFKFFEELRKSGLPAKGIVTMVNKVAEQSFANGRAAMAFNGSWCVNVYAGMNPKLNYGVFLPPAVNPSNPRAIWGGAGSSFFVNAHSPRKEKAVAFLRWLTEKEQQVYLAKETRNLPSSPDALGDIPAVLAQFADDMEATVHPSQFPVSEKQAVIESFNKNLQSILIGEKTAEQAAQAIQRVKENESTNR